MYKILIVDDEESVRYSFTKLLRAPEYQVLGAKDGNEGIAKVEQEKPDLVIMDIQMPDLIQYFMTKHCAHLKREAMIVAAETMKLLQDYAWPGNVRELEHLLKRAILLAKSNVITPEAVAEDLHLGEKASSPTPFSGDRLSLFVAGDLEHYHGKLYETVIAEVEEDLIIVALKKFGGNQVRAAQLLGISRVMLHDRIEKYGIKTEVIVQNPE